ncbi:hypothetical protein HOLleu_35987 [Holothuria leucospilota]|uniref:Uncharacterized protein n=1 Tax=Holothuria leucospilota TaxID=206669 RepID=A0A9Q1BFR6_HOLLE|nr:hypothetical protein HOLleu_35987 [Holothuria leucospilota]
MSFLDHFNDKFPVALSSKEIGTYVGVALMPTLMEFLRSTYGLQGSYLVLGAIAWNCIPCGLLLKSPAGKPSTQSLVVELKLICCAMNCCRENKSLSRSGDNFGRVLLEKFTNFVKLFSLAPAIAHPRFAIYLILHSMLYYILAAWALYLVPFGVSNGLSQTIAVYLSTAGGLGGLAGKLLAIVLFHFDKMNIWLAGVFPSIVCCFGLAGYMLTTDFIWLLIFSSICGFSIAFSDSALSAMLPLYVCDHHLKQGSALGYLFAGVFLLLGGIVSGRNLISYCRER